MATDDEVTAALVSGEDRVLRIVRRLCLEYEAPMLWRTILTTVLELETDDAFVEQDARYREVTES